MSGTGRAAAAGSGVARGAAAALGGGRASGAGAALGAGGGALSGRGSRRAEPTGVGGTLGSGGTGSTECSLAPPRAGARFLVSTAPTSAIASDDTRASPAKRRGRSGGGGAGRRRIRACIHGARLCRSRAAMGDSYATGAGHGAPLSTMGVGGTA